MQHQFPYLNRRQYLSGLAAASATAILACDKKDADTTLTDGELETTSIRLIRETKFAILCYAPQYVAEELLRAEGFTDIQYVPKGVKGSEAEALLAGNADMSAALGVDWIMPISQKRPVVVLSGMHAGCIEVFATPEIKSVRDLKGKRLAVHGLGSPERYLLASIVAYIGHDPEEIDWVFSTPNEWAQLLADRKVDAIVTFPPLNYHLHKEKIGHVILNTLVDDPWKQHLCCLIGARREFVEKYPVATKRALRAILKANQLCTAQPQQMAKWLVDNGQATNAEYALRTLRDLPYDAWHDYDPVETMRFYALRLREAKLITDTPNQIIERGTDWRFFNELKKEVKT